MHAPSMFSYFFCLIACAVKSFTAWVFVAATLDDFQESNFHKGSLGSDVSDVK
jgi:hypothetical protein